MLKSKKNSRKIDTYKVIKKKLQVVSKELDFISNLDRRFVYEHDLSLEKILKESIKIAPALLGTNMCNIRILDGSKGSLMTKASKGLSKKFTSNTVMAVGEGVAGIVAATKKPIIVKDAPNSKILKFQTYMQMEGIQSVLCVPIILGDDVSGTISVYDRRASAFTEKDKRLLFNFANHVAILIDNIRAHKKIFFSYINTIKSLVSAVEARDKYTSGHSEKVTKFSLEIAHAIGLSKADRMMLSYCGRLHDIGKIAISDSILNKPAALSPNERLLIQTHPERGVKILSNLQFLKEGISAVRSHHERHDGKGYPEKLKGKEIPLLAKIIGCADAYDAMTSDRAYRHGMTTKEAIEEIKINRGKQFDPDISGVFIDIIKESHA